MSALRRLWLVTTSRGNLFMTELLEGLAEAVRGTGVDAQVVTDAWPEADDHSAYVVIPHEYFATTDPALWPDDARLRRTIALCTEQPGTTWLETAVAHARRCGAAVDIHLGGVHELRKRGVAAEHLQLGHLEAWDRWGGDPDRERPVDVLFMGTVNAHRDRLLARYADTLWPRRTELIIAGIAAKPVEGPDFVLGERKRERLARSKLLLSPRRQVTPYFEWVRAVEAAANGCVLVTDNPAGCEPFVPGEHFLAGAPESLGLLCDAILRDPGRLAAMRDAAYDLLVADLPMRAAAERLVAVGDGVLRRPPAHEIPPPPTPSATAVPPADAVAREEDLAAKRAALDAIAERRRVATERARAAGEDADGVDVAFRTAAYERASPRVTVCVPCFEHAEEIGEAVASVAAQSFDALELLVLDDASGDGSADAVRAALEQRPWLPAALLRRRVNGGLPRARNRLVEQARGELVLMLDADNALFPPAIERLVAALDAEPAALFAYPTLQGHRDGEPVRLLSFRAWDPQLLRAGNVIDALALLRRDRLIALGGYTEDLRMYGWEDYDLWARAAEHGEHGVHVPETLARYRLGDDSMRSVTDLDTSEMRALLRERYPRTMAPML